MQIEPKQLAPLGEAGLLLYPADPDRYFIFKPRWDGGYVTGTTVVAGWPAVPLRTWPALLSPATEQGARYREYYAQTQGPEVPVFPTAGPKGQLRLADGLWYFKVGSRRYGVTEHRPERTFGSIEEALPAIIGFYSHEFTEAQSDEELARVLASV